MNILKICTYYLIISFSLIFSIGIAGIVLFLENAVTKQLKVVKTCTLPHNYPGAERTAAMSKYRKKEA